MTSGTHRTAQTAFRIPEGLLAWLRARAAAEQRTLTALVIEALQAYRDTMDA